MICSLHIHFFPITFHITAQTVTSLKPQLTSSFQNFSWNKTNFDWMQCKQRFNLKVFLYFFALSKARNNSWVIEDLKRENKGLKSSNFLHFFFFFQKNFSPGLQGDEKFLHPQRQKQLFYFGPSRDQGCSSKKFWPLHGLFYTPCFCVIRNFKFYVNTIL